MQGPRPALQLYEWREPAKLKPAATLILLRDAPELEVLMSRRSMSASFLPGAYVFPGGMLDPQDQTVVGTPVCPTTDQPAMTQALAVAAVREAYEELGILLASRGPGQHSLQRDQALLAQLEKTGGSIDTRQLASFSHWLTDRNYPKRFDVRFFVAAMPEGQIPIADGQEQFDPVWIRPQEALERHARGEFNIIFPTVRTLRHLCSFNRSAQVMAYARSLTEESLPTYCPRAGLRQGEDSLHTEDEPEFGELALVTPDGQIQHRLDWQSEQAVPLLKHVWRLTAPNASMMTGPGTNTYLIGGRGSYAVIDPGPAIESHIERILKFCDGGLAWIFCTHSHPDHHPAAARLAERTGAKVLGLPLGGSAPLPWHFAPTHIIHDGERFKICEEPVIHLRAVHTPGHASNHVCYWLEEDGLLFSGDHILNGVTPVIAPPDGHMKDYLDSLSKLRELPVSFILPAHGYVMDQPTQVIDKLVAHRLRREAKVLAAFEKLQSADPARLVSLVYDDVDPRLHRLAQDSLRAHLIKLVGDGKIAGIDLEQ